MAVLDVLLPPSCAGCGHYGSAICAACRQTFRRLGGGGFLAPDPGVLVGEACTVAVAAFAHDGAIQRVLRQLKYGGGARLAAPLADLALPALHRLLRETGPAVLVPVPLHEERRRDRGYNQAALLAQRLGRQSRTETWQALVRRRATVRQHGLDRATRMRNLRDAMRMSSAAPPPGHGQTTVILVDDILTTGATLEASAGVLRAAGVPAVYGFAIAREV
jgi:ComF family protein